MDVVITGRHINVTSNLRDTIQDKIDRLTRVFAHLHDARVIVESNGLSHRVEVMVGADRGHRFLAHAEAPGIRTAINRVEGKMLTQLRRHKRKRQSLRTRRWPVLSVGVE